MSKSYADVVLEIATELELTVRRGDFLKVLERLVRATKTGKSDTVIHWTLRQLDKKLIGQQMDLELGDRIELTIDLVVSDVLANRQVAPQDVVDVFVTEAGPSRSIRLEQNERGHLIFRLTQIYVYDEDMLARHQSIGQIVSHEGDTSDTIVEVAIKNTYSDGTEIG